MKYIRTFLFICLLVITQILINISLLETRYIISLEQEKNRVLELQDMVFDLEELDYNYDTYIEDIVSLKKLKEELLSNVKELEEDIASREEKIIELRKE